MYAEVEKMYKEYQAEKVLLTDEMKQKREEEIVQKERQTKDLQKKRCGYLSAEFLIGRMIYANLLNTDMLDEAKNILKNNNIDINVFEEVEDAALNYTVLVELALHKKRI